MLKGAVAGTSPTGPWTAGGTGVRTPDNDDCQSMAHTTRPPMPLAYNSVKMLQTQRIYPPGGSKTDSSSGSITNLWRSEKGGQKAQVKP